MQTQKSLHKNRQCISCTRKFEEDKTIRNNINKLHFIFPFSQNFQCCCLLPASAKVTIHDCSSQKRNTCTEKFESELLVGVF